MDVISSNTTVDIASLNEKINRESAFVDVLNMELGKAIVGQKYMVERLMLALLAMLQRAATGDQAGDIGSRGHRRLARPQAGAGQGIVGGRREASARFGGAGIDR